MHMYKNIVKSDGSARSSNCVNAPHFTFYFVSNSQYRLLSWWMKKLLFFLDYAKNDANRVFANTNKTPMCRTVLRKKKHNTIVVHIWSTSTWMDNAFTYDQKAKIKKKEGIKNKTIALNILCVHQVVDKFALDWFLFFILVVAFLPFSIKRQRIYFDFEELHFGKRFTLYFRI